MKQKIPLQLCNSYYKFLLIKKNEKIPIEKNWNNIQNYKFFEPKLLNHLLKGNNIGIITGYGGLIIIDFDDENYQKEKEKLLPKTFTCRTAGKGLKHFYYTLKGDMISKIGIGLEKRLCDIQANKSPITCPPSSINGKFYSVIDETPVQEIEWELLSRIFEINLQKRYLKGEIDYEPQPEKVEKAIQLFKSLGMERKGKTRFACPFHESNGKSGNISILPSGAIKCFHCDYYFKSFESFEKYYSKQKIII